MITAQNITAHEWIGLKVKVSKSTDPTLQGLEGIVRDETMNTFTIEVNGKLRQVQKQKTTFRAELSTENVEVNGSLLRFRPEDRVKKGLRKW
ncbi:ribonuclease P protein component 1 [Candidatus Bathyarchaeota archaeon]|nr:MAG: ribonuclease P protein component 1 [Candidatus Bathyarchaeota archaeon]TMI53703.1 MAG: ribonuclease P protein component 1 [Candidatus Bathyarchaeota archaeon]